MRTIVTTCFFLTLLACSGEDASKIKIQTGVMLSNGIITNSLAYNDLVDAYKNYIFEGAKIKTQSANDGYLMEINKFDEMTKKNVSIEIMFQNHASDSENYLIATRIIIDGAEGMSGDVLAVVRDLPVKLCMSQPSISYCKDF